jgi:histidyl-tRNA synthetase
MIQLIRGFKDILPGDIELWQTIERTAVTIFEDFNFSEIRLPILERADLFARSIGENTDIVEKEMYTFPDRKGALITLRPEATASVVRSYIQHKLYAVDPVQKFYTIGPMFRRERPQKGRYRQFYQINAEVFGIASPLVDAQLIYMLTLLFRRLAVMDVEVHLNSLGCPECRPKYKAALKKLLDGCRNHLCDNCLRRSETNPLRVLDCKIPACREALSEAPELLSFLCGECRKHFETVVHSLEKQNIPYVIDKRLVRGLDYYTRTTFEIQTSVLGAQNAVAGGGRYDGLVKALGGPDQPAVGFAVGFDRLAEIVAQFSTGPSRKIPLLMIPLGENSQQRMYEWYCAAGRAGIKTEMDFSGRSLKSLMKRADKLNAEHVLICGDQELEAGHAVLRNMQTSQQQMIPLTDLVERLQIELKANA